MDKLIAPDSSLHAVILPGSGCGTDDAEGPQLFVLDIFGYIQFFGNARLLGRSAAEVRGHPLSDFLPGLALGTSTPAYNLAYVGGCFGENQWLRHIALAPDGREIPLDLTLRKVYVEGQFWLLALLRAAEDSPGGASSSRGEAGPGHVSRLEMDGRLAENPILPFSDADRRADHVAEQSSASAQHVEPCPSADDNTVCLPNRQVFYHRLQHALARAGDQGARVGVACIKLDHLAEVLLAKDQPGILSRVAACLQACMRKGDTAARMAAGEFALILEDMSDGSAERVLQRIAATFRQGAQDAFSVSMGLSVFPEHGQEELQLMLRADCALQQAQAAGGGCHALFGNAPQDFGLLWRMESLQAA